MSASGGNSIPSDSDVRRVPLFPLPNSVLFPHVAQPLHVFETRYRALVQEALQGDGVVAMATLAAGWEEDYEGRPPIEPAVCVGRIVSHTQLDDGRHNILLLGEHRGRIVLELPPDRPYRRAEVAIVADEYPTSGAAVRADLQRELLERFRMLAPAADATEEEIGRLLGDQAPLGLVTDLIAYTLPFDFSLKVELLGDPNVDRRGHLLLDRFGPIVERLRGEARDVFPPDFSDN